MKITFILPTVNLSGGVRVAAIYADRLQQRGHNVNVVSVPCSPPTLKEQIRSLISGKGWLSTQVEPSHFDSLNIPHHIINHAPPIVDADVPDGDIVIATWWETAEWVANLSPQKGKKVYFIQHHEVFDYLPVERVKRTYTLPLHKITISKWLIDLMGKNYGDHQVFLVPNSVDTDLFNAPLRSKQTIPTVGLLYSDLPWKGCDVSFRAIALAQKTLPQLQVLTFGAVPPAPTLTFPAHTEYIYRPVQDKIKDLYAQCDVWLCGSRSEGFHLPPLEAMACRTPVVSTVVGGPVDIIEQGVNGYLAPLEDAETLAEYLLQVLQQSELQWETMSQSAYNTAISYTWDDATTLFESALKTLNANSNASSMDQT